jgi:hypothetical protein
MPVAKVLRILVVEDEFLIAADLEQTLVGLGCECIGPVATIEKAKEFIPAGGIDGAILNLVLQNERADEIANLLEENEIPFAFASAIGAADHDPRWHKKPKLTKPYRLDEVQKVLGELFPDDASLFSDGVFVTTETAPEKGPPTEP